MSNTTKSETTQEMEIQQYPYLQALIALAVLTIVEVGVGYFESTTIILLILGILAVTKAAVVAAIFMHVAYEKDTRNIILIGFIIPLIGVFLLASFIFFDYR